MDYAPTEYSFKVTHKPLYNTLHYNTILNVTPFKDGSQKCINYIKNNHKFTTYIHGCLTHMVIKTWCIFKVISDMDCAPTFSSFSARTLWMSSDYTPTSL